jgi:hypothetical protein
MLLLLAGEFVHELWTYTKNTAGHVCTIHLFV